MLGLSVEQLVLFGLIAVAHLVSIAFILLILFSPLDPNPSPSESTYVSASSPSTPQSLSKLSAPPTLHLSVVVPAYNESLRLAVMLRPAIEYLETRNLDESEIKTLPNGIEEGSYEVLIVDDGSKDDTVKVALKLAKELEEEFGAKRGIVKVCSLVRNRGKGGATRHGVLHASGHRILFVDADGATNFSDLSLLEAELDSLEHAQQSSSSSPPHGIIVGSRAHLVSTEAVVKRSLLRNLLMRSFHLYLSLLGLRTIRDTQCGFKLHARASAAHLYPSLHSPGWIFDCELLLLAELTGIPLREVGVRWHEVGGSKLDVVWDSIRMARDLLVIRGNHLTGRWKSPSKVDVRIDEGTLEGKKQK
ncbi:dolichyl-phosphate beta-glucosyltransferase [Sporobolomyces salmoneus]|uniref:dolichyl-phosphate beta-glucosyltransferase n=1 Tax=Sporobolomyces salmoneus TaxID=183962 RepID=UPI00316CC486